MPISLSFLRSISTTIQERLDHDAVLCSIQEATCGVKHRKSTETTSVVTQLKPTRLSYRRARGLVYFEPKKNLAFEEYQFRQSNV